MFSLFRRAAHFVRDITYKFVKAMTKTFRSVLIATLMLGVSACTPTIAKRGNLLEDDQVKQITPGVHTRTDALKILGSPTTQSPFDENVWYYIGQETEKTGIFDPKVTKERIIAVTFDENGTIKQIVEIPPGQEDVPLETATTPTHGNDITLMQQLLGNLGKFNNSKEANR